MELINHMKPKVSVLIQFGDTTTVLELPQNVTELRSSLLSAGIQESPACILLTDNEGDALRVKLYGENELGKHLVRLFSEQENLAEANTVVFLTADFGEAHQKELFRNILTDRYSSLEQLLDGMKEMLQSRTVCEEVFYFPLTVIYREDGFDDGIPVGSGYLLPHEDELRQILKGLVSRSDLGMAHYYNLHPRTCGEAVSMDWSFEEIQGQIYGRVDVRLAAPLSPREKKILKDWIRAQNMDGMFESFECYDIEVEDGVVNVSFGGDGNADFLYDRQEMDDWLQQRMNRSGQSQGMMMGGM